MFAIFRRIHLLTSVATNKKFLGASISEKGNYGNDDNNDDRSCKILALLCIAIW
jgi:hypothetical protein